MIATTTDKHERLFGHAKVLLLVSIFALVGALVTPLPTQNELERARGELAAITEVSKGKFNIRVTHGGKDNVEIAVQNLTLVEIERTRNLRPGAKIEVWYLETWFFSMIFDMKPFAWQVVHDGETILAYSSRFAEFLFTTRLFLGLAGLTAASALALFAAGRIRRW